MDTAKDTGLGVNARVTDSIREAIQTGGYEPGARLVERKLAEMYGVSHIPVREALRALAEEGLVEKIPRRGARVAELTARDLQEIASLRSVLEEFAARRALTRMTPAREKELRRIVASMLKAARSGATLTLLELDRQFHEQIWEYTDHTLLLTVNRQVRGRIGGFLRSAHESLGKDARVTHAHSHALIVDALVSGDEERAVQVMTEHIAMATRRIAEYTGLELSDGSR